MPIPHQVNRRGRSFAFTLIELLVVTVIVAVLVALLMPVVSRVRMAGYKANCLQNMRTYGRAVLSYANDHNGTIVPHLAGDDGNRKIWQQILVEGGYLPAGKTQSGGRASYVPDKLRCPANPNGYLRGERQSDNPEERFKYGTPNYLYNVDAGTPVSLNGRSPVPVLKLSQMGARKAIFFEGGEYKPYNNAYRCDYAVNPNAAYFDPDNANFKVAGDVHNGSSHVLFWDGHIETISKGDFRVRKHEIWKYADWRTD